MGMNSFSVKTIYSALKYGYVIWQSIFGYRIVLGYAVRSLLSSEVSGILMIYEIKYLKLCLSQIFFVSMFISIISVVFFL